MPSRAAMGREAEQNRLLSARVAAAQAEQAKEKQAKILANKVKEKNKELKNIEIQLTNLNTRLTQATFEETRASNAYVAYQLQHPNPNAGQQAVSLQLRNAFKAKANAVTLLNSQIATTAKEYSLVQNNGQVSARASLANSRAEYQVRKAVKDAKSKPKAKITAKTPAQTDPPATPSIRFNAPMVRAAYFNNASPSVKAVVPQAVLPMLRDTQGLDALKTFGPQDTNRGFIIPNKIARDAALKRVTAGQAGVVGGFKIPFGFRFHYNPQNVQQSYGTLVDLSPELLMSGNDQANMITSPTQSSTISFSLYLNRIDDMYALVKLTPEDSSLQYPEKLTQEDINLIKNFGTMYDLDFLFKSINGEMNGYKSPLRGIKTGDIGWLNGMAIELHLGRKLRYLARILNISVNHILFTESMIPTLSIVSIQCHRFHDTTQIDAKK